MSSTIRKSDQPALSILEKQQRERAVREGIASARIEGGSVTSGAQAIMDEWSQGLFDEETAIARIKALHGV